MSSSTTTTASTSSPSAGVAVTNIPNFDFFDQRNYSWKLNVVNIIFLCVVIISVSLRCGVRAFVVKAFGLDDGT